MNLEVHLLPFLKNRQAQQTGIIVKQRAPDAKKEDEGQDDPSAAHHACAADLLRAIENKDIKGIAEAMQAAFEIMDSEPHVEGKHVEPHSYDAQNQKAAE